MVVLSRHVALVIALGLAGSARADTQQPWVAGVTAEQKAQAKVLLDAGNTLFLEKKYAEALEQYKGAVAAWNHPAIRFNIVRCLIQLDRAVEAAENLKLALAFGAAPLEEAVYTEALAYEKLLANQIGDITVECAQPGVKLTLDGQPLATCPAKEARRMSPGPHQIVGTKPGLLTQTKEIVVIGGKHQAISISLDPLAKAARVEHRWPGYVPWLVFGSGFGLVAIGGVLSFSARSDRDSYDLFVDQRCATTTCSEADLADVQDLKDGARLKSGLGASILIAGGATVVTGAVMLYLNRGRTVYPEQVNVPAVTPLPGGAAVTFAGSF